jgi:hypothetical protein
MRWGWLWSIVLTIATTLPAANLPRVSTDLSIVDLDGHLRHPLRAESAARILFFIAPDCPIANSYAPEIQRLCSNFKGMDCALVYVDPQLDSAGALKHRSEFGYVGFTAFLDSSDKLADAVGATVTPEAVVIARDGRIAYRGRIDNRWVTLGKARPQATVFDLKNALDEIAGRKTVTVPETKPVGCYISRAGILSK